jgi:hypothetical protein
MKRSTLFLYPASCFFGLVCSAAAQAPIRIIFLHHSYGESLINAGGVRIPGGDRGLELTFPNRRS